MRYTPRGRPVIAQRLRYRSDLKIPVPECEVLIPTSAVKAHLRAGDLFKIASALEIGADAGIWTFARYQTWLEAKKSWHIPGAPEAPEAEVGEAAGYLLHYPYGCVEQTCSSLLPWLALNQHPAGQAILARSQLDRRRALATGLDRLLSMQTTSGGLAR